MTFQGLIILKNLPLSFDKIQNNFLYFSSHLCLSILKVLTMNGLCFLYLHSLLDINLQPQRKKKIAQF